MSNRRYDMYDPEREYWNDGQEEEEFTMYKPVKNNNKKFIFRDEEEPVKKYSSPYGTSNDYSTYSTNSSKKSNPRKSRNDYKSYDRRNSGSRYSYSSSSRNSGSRKVYSNSSTYSPKSSSSKNPPSSRTSSSSSSTSSGWRYNTSPDEEKKRTASTSQTNDEYDSILIEEEDSDEEDDENGFVLRPGNGFGSPSKDYSKGKSSSGGYQKFVLKSLDNSSSRGSNYSSRKVLSARPNQSKKSEKFERNSESSSTPSNIRTYQPPKKLRKEVTKEVKSIGKEPVRPSNIRKTEYKPSQTSSSSRKVYFGNPNQTTSTKNSKSVIKKPKERRRTTYVIPPKKFDRVYFEELKSSPMLLIQAFRGIIKKHIKSISPLNPNQDKPSMTDTHDNQANMIQILRKTPILVASYPQQVKEIEKKLKTNPNDAESLKKLVLCQATLKNYREARRAIAAVLAIVPRDPLIFDFLSIINEEQGKIGDALNNLEKLIEYDKKNGDKNRARYHRLLNQWFRSQESEPKLPSNLKVQSRELSPWISYANRVIQYWDIQLSEDDDDEEEEEEEEDEGEAGEAGLPIGGEKRATAIIECIYYGFGSRKYELALKSCEKLIRWFKRFSNLLDDHSDLEKKNSWMISSLTMCRAFCRVEMKDYKKAIDDSNTAMRNLEVLDDLLVMSKRLVLKSYGEYTQSRSKVRNIAKDYAPFLRTYLTENLKLMDTLNISLDTKSRIDQKLKFLLERAKLFIEVINEPAQALPDLETSILLCPNDPDLYNIRSEVYEKMNQPSKALMDVKTAVRLKKGGTTYNQFKRRKDLSDMADDEVDEGGRSESKGGAGRGQQESVHIPGNEMFNKAFNIKDRLRKMESGENLPLIDYMNIDSAPTGSFDQSLHYLVKSENRKHFYDMEVGEFINHAVQEVKMMSIIYNHSHHENIMPICGYKKFSNEAIGLCYEYIPESLMLDQFIEQERTRQRRKAYEYRTTLEKWEMILQFASVVHGFHSNGIVLRNISPRGCVAYPSQDMSMPSQQLGRPRPSQPKILLKWFDVTYASNEDENGGVSPLHVGIEKALRKSEKHLMRYKAPETIFDHKYSKKSDIFSLGMVIFQIATSFEPFHGTDAKKAQYRIFSGDHPTKIRDESSKKKKKKKKKKVIQYELMLKDMEPEFIMLIERCLHGDPNKRPSAQEVCEIVNKKKKTHELKMQVRQAEIAQEEIRREERRREAEVLKERERMKEEFVRKEMMLEARHKEVMEKKDSQVVELLKRQSEKDVKSSSSSSSNSSSSGMSKEAAKEAEKTLSQMKSICRSLENLRNLFQCPISLEIFEEPMLVVESGGVYEKTAINRWLKKHRTDPISNQVLLSKKRVPLKHLKNIIEEWRKTQLILEKTVGK